ncbi:isoleucine--tRNA ligase [Flavobacterium johnsoniae]|uniref:Isoleucine--tRNA ligase n=1 Tax=Flavobacterium johnsoniae (strain ATCC 17061 / DSM 2064 / JCM 8514 / BCRC 14874 / CCUG 350202 / NBRC 14942 / NCIMB 11054 / UW101) TaxID=376686 RepID=A5FM29_FLAJ1|nr:isoleucine--tRNA ligase [Flavobacterium johnsoniae]ABQ03739.1 isoleucyl-tRNA synthetase [Flavobacterium johnsoniae UW101]OXG03261.1 isoleucine--tRNA ligase [Flavobacterium johnsoniae UW101]WQG79396.1 isoleucine--tRNA ligase [Flavobacterium johnsoniae UW101]SHK01314.1 Isoleucyl-tRNA synthetase [Flavobacterium johnsoniae]
MSTKFTEYKGLDLPAVASEVLDFWKKENIFEKSVTTREGAEPFVFFEGPPSANGLPGIHHVMARAIKDIFCRYKTQKGFQVKRKAGWDTHGLPVELGTEKELGITKEDIGKTISIEEYNEACKKTVMRYTDVWNDLTEKMGYWVDMDDPYVTYKPKYMESVWWLLKQIYDKGLLYKGYTIQPYSPKAGTGLSSHEVNQPGAYRDVTDTTIVAQFKTLPETLPSFLQGFGDIHILAWTTTPWTLPSNTALTVGPKIDYVLVKTFNQYTFEPINVILAKNLVGKQFGKGYFVSEDDADFDNVKNGDKKLPYKILTEAKGADLVEIRYEQLLPYVLPYQNAENAFRVISGDFVTTEDGTGIVHTAPTFGADDAKVAKEAKPEVPPMLVLDENGTAVPLVDLQGKFTSHVGDLAGKYVKNEYYDAGQAPEKSVDVEIAIRLKEENKAFKVEKYVHSYPHSWRTDEPLLYYPLDSWFIKVTDVKDRMFDLNETINWKPKSTGEGRFGNWLKNANDWNLSRSRYWGIPLPIWRTEDKTEEVIIGSVEELYNAIEKSIEAGFQKENPFKDFEIGNMSESNYDLIDLHKNVVDAITLVSASGKPMKRESDLIDVWFDSGAMPYAQWHYPFENKEKIDDNKDFPANFIAEGVDQTRGWFYTLHAIGTLVFDKVAYKNVVSNGLVLDKNGIKMSKSKGNTIDPFKTIAENGPDATRWYMIMNANPWDNLKFDLEGIAEVKRKFFGTLYNTYSFFSLYANIDGFKYEEAEIPLNERPEIDQWIISELHSLIKFVDECYEDYEPTKATRAISDFVQENLSNWYVRLCRRRFWKGEYAKDKIAAYQTLYTCLLTISKLSAPVAPFFMDKLYRDLTTSTGSEDFASVHLAEFPKFVENFVNKTLESKMQKAQTISSLVLSLRKKEMIKVRQPLQKVMIPVLDDNQRAEIEAISDLVKAEVNVKEIELLDDASGILVKQIKPNFKALGPRFGKDMGLISKEIQGFSADQINQLDKQGTLDIVISGNNVTLSLEDVEITSQDIEGWLVANSNGITVALDITISEELKNEGIARELVNRIQNIRKDSGFEVTDKIKVQIKRDGNLEEAVLKNEDYIKSETLTDDLVFADALENGTEIEFDDIKTMILISK